MSKNTSIILSLSRCAFLHFCAEKRPKLRVESPAASIGALAKQLSLAWKVMTPDQKRPYEEMAFRDKVKKALKKMEILISKNLRLVCLSPPIT